MDPIQLPVRPATQAKGGLTYEFHALPVGAQNVGHMDCKPGTRIHSVVPLPRSTLATQPLMVLVILEIDKSGRDQNG